VLAVRDLLDAIDRNREPVANLKEARVATEMVVAIFESHRQGKAVTFPPEVRKNPLTLL
jgi:hypothetical protein